MIPLDALSLLMSLALGDSRQLWCGYQQEVMYSLLLHNIGCVAYQASKVRAWFGSISGEVSLVSRAAGEPSEACFPRL
jgi:hypothetical protein